MNNLFKFFSLCLFVFGLHAVADDLDVIREQIEPRPLFWLFDAPDRGFLEDKVKIIQTIARHDVNRSSLRWLTVDEAGGLKEIEGFDELWSSGVTTLDFHWSSVKKRRSCYKEMHVILFLSRAIINFDLLELILESFNQPQLSFKLDIFDLVERTEDQVRNLQGLVARSAGKYVASNYGRWDKELFNRTTSYPRFPTWVIPIKGVDESNLKKHNQSYFSVIQPDASGDWFGNVKRYQENELGTLFDADGNYATSEGLDFLPDSRSWWTFRGLGGDGGIVERGGLSSRLNNEAAYTYLGEYKYERMNGWASVPENPRLAIEDNRLPDSLIPNKLGSIIHSGLYLLPSDNNKSAPGSLFASTNHGFFHMFDVQPSDGDLSLDEDKPLEVFRFLPKELLPKLNEKITKSRGTLDDTSGDAKDFQYGLDGPWTLLHDRQNTDGLTAKEKLFVYAGMRRGGRNLYALDISTLKGVSIGSGIDPKLLFVIRGGVDANHASPYKFLGQTWSKPQVGKIRVQGESRAVIIFGGGYDDAHYDESSGPTNIGNQVHIVDAQTGHLYWSGSAGYRTSIQSHTAGKTRLQRVKRLKYGIASELKLLDTNLDSYTDLIYFGDLGGQVWRLVLDNSVQTYDSSFIKLEPILSVGDSWKKQPVHDRRFFYPPSVSYLGGYTYALSIVSGNPAAPFDRSVQDGLFVVYDKPFLSGDKNTNNHKTLTPCHLTTQAATEKGITGCGFNNNRINSDDVGWKLMFDQEKGERALGTPFVFNYNLFFSTQLYQGSKTKDSIPLCYNNSNLVRVYGLNIKPGWTNQPSVYFQFYELIEDNPFYIEKQTLGTFGQSLTFDGSHYQEKNGTFSIKLGSKIIAEFELLPQLIKKTRWIPHERSKTIH